MNPSIFIPKLKYHLVQIRTVLSVRPGSRWRQVVSCELLGVFLHFPLEEKISWGPFYQLGQVLAKGRHLNLTESTAKPYSKCSLFASLSLCYSWTSLKQPLKMSSLGGRLWEFRPCWIRILSHCYKLTEETYPRFRYFIHVKSRFWDFNGSKLFNDIPNEYKDINSVMILKIRVLEIL